MDPKRPTFLIIGAQKCGTTALHSILAAHPDCCMSEPKEVHFFQSDWGNADPDANYRGGWDWYRRAFSHYSGQPVVGEASPTYADRRRGPNTAMRIHDFNREMKIIYMVRDPLERQISEWRMFWAAAKGAISKPKSEYVRIALSGFEPWMRYSRNAHGWTIGLYHYQLQPYMECFPRKQILVSFLEDWKEDKASELDRIRSFVGLDPSRKLDDFAKEANRAEDREIYRDFSKPLLRGVGAHATIRGLVRCFPKSWREKVKQHARTRAVAPEPILSAELRAEFTSHVRPDAERFLSVWGKPSTYWEPTVFQSA